MTKSRNELVRGRDALNVLLAAQEQYASRGSLAHAFLMGAAKKFQEVKRHLNKATLDLTQAESQLGLAATDYFDLTRMLGENRAKGMVPGLRLSSDPDGTKNKKKMEDEEAILRQYLPQEHVAETTPPQVPAETTQFYPAPPAPPARARQSELDPEIVNLLNEIGVVKFRELLLAVRAGLPLLKGAGAAREKARRLEYPLPEARKRRGEHL